MYVAVSRREYGIVMAEDLGVAVSRVLEDWFWITFSAEPRSVTKTAIMSGRA
ncbi:hypothetical protein ACFYPT_40320 [Streptomyces sp. NPDC005529]|uniref:hypothetical protein n=1 Tax=unclassified Streptomyces TaxID=2593676 RepID=UPI0033AF9C42